MGASGHRFHGAALLAGLAFCVASACGGAVSTSLDRPPSGSSSPGDDGMAQNPRDAGSGSSSGGREDATVADESNHGDGMGSDAGDSGGDDVAEPPMEAGPPDANLCGLCAGPNAGVNRCCMKPGAFSYGLCYNAILCGGCCM